MEYDLSQVRDLIRAVQNLLRVAMSASNSPSHSTSTAPEEENKRKLETFMACADPGRKKSLRSLEIPLENLLSGVIFLSGGRDLVGRPIISLTQPEQGGVEELMDMTEQELLDMIAYFISVPSEEARSNGFTAVIDGDVIHDFLMRPMIKALATIQNENRDLLRKVYYVSNSRDISQIDWNVEFSGHHINLPFHQVGNYQELSEFIDSNQLTPEFGGSLSYSHQDWVKFRMQVEPFLCDCISISKRLARAIEPFTDDYIPETIQEAEESIQKNKLVRRKTLEALHIDELACEGSRINSHMKLKKQLSNNPEFNNTLDTITKLMEQIDTVKGRLELLWSTKQEKLETSLKQQMFENNAKQIIEWYEEYAEEFFQTHTELGESLDIALALEQEVKQFEDSTQQILKRAGKLVRSGSDLETRPHADREAVSQLMGKVKHLMGDFDRRLSFRKKKLNDSVRLHQLTESALDWCIESAGVLSEHDLLSSDPQNMDVDRVKRDFDQFLQNYPAPTDEELHQLQELTEAIGNAWIKGNAEFAYNRVMEVSAKFQHYSRMLEGMAADKKKQGKDGDERGRDVEIDCDSDKSIVSNGEVEDVDYDGVLSDSNTIIPHIVSDVQLRSTQKDVGTSLQYDNEMMGLEEALMLLQDVEKTASHRLNSSTSEGESGQESAVFTETSEARASPLLQNISKRDISLPTKTAGPLFTSQADNLDQDDESDLEEVRPSSVPPEEIPRPVSLQDIVRARVLSGPCPDSDSELAAQTKHAKHRRKLMEELIETEEAYIRALQWVVDEYMPAMDCLEDVPKNLFGKKNYIFSTLPQLLQFNRLVILPQLQACRKCPIKLGSLFLTFEEDLLNYSMYFKNMPQQTRLMNEGGTEFFANVSQRIRDNFTLQSYLIKPFQRMTKYRLFLEDMIKHSVKSDLKGKLKEYYDHLKEAQKMADFILRHGNDLLAVECLRGYDGIKEQGKILRQGDLTVVEISKHRRRVFLFENAIVLSKKRKPKHQHHDIPGSEYFDFKAAYKTNEFSLRENIEGHPTRFELKRKKEILVFQADTEEDKNIWVSDIWDLFFSHMLALKDQNLEVYGSRPLTSLAAVGPNRSATIGRSFGHNVRRAMSMRYSGGMRIRQARSRPGSTVSNISAASSSSSHRASGGPPEELAVTMQSGGNRSLSPAPQNRHSGTFVDLRSRSPSRLSVDIEESESKRSSIVSTSSASTIISLNLPPISPLPPSPHSPVPHGSSPAPTETVSKLISAVHRAGEGRSPRPSNGGASSGDDASSNDSKEIEETITVFDTPL